MLLDLLLHLQTRVQVDPTQARLALETALTSEGEQSVIVIAPDLLPVLTEIAAQKDYGLGSTEALACAMVSQCFVRRQACREP